MRRPSPARDSAGGSEHGEGTLFGGRLILVQPRRGYRVNVDTLLLAQFAAQGRPKARRVVDLGAGVGELARLSAQNLARAGLAGAPHVVDLEHGGLPAALRGAADVVLSNPPFFPES